MMDILKKNLYRVAFFKPIILSKDIRDIDIEFMLQRYKLDMNYEDCYGYDVDYVESMLVKGKFKELINQLLLKFKRLETMYNFVLCEGISDSFLHSKLNFNINAKIASNFSSAYINVINAKELKYQEIYDRVIMENQHILSLGCKHFSTFINRVDNKTKLSKEFVDLDLSIHYFEEQEDLSLLSIEDIIDSLDVKILMLSDGDKDRVIRNISVAGLTLDNFLDHIQEDDLVIVPADRSDIILGLFGALYSKAYPNISGIIFPFDMKAHPNIQKLLNSLDGFSIPILSINLDTYQTAKALSKVHPRFRVDSKRKIALASGLFNKSVDIECIEQMIKKDVNDIMTPIMFEYKLFDLALANKKTIILPESEDERVLRAVDIILRRGVVDIVLLGDKEQIRENYLRIGLDLSSAKIIDHRKSELMDSFVDKFYEMRKAKGLSYIAAKDAMLHKNYFATMIVYCGYVDGMVSGATHSTSDTIRPALQIIKTKPNISVVSSVFFMCLETKVLVYGDCAINQDPNSEILAEIAFSSAKTAKAFEIEPKIAMLSYSTGNSGAGVDVDKVREATEILIKKDATLLVEGPIQYDAAINESVAKTKLPNSKVAGHANVFIFPDLNTGNNTYKAVQRSSEAVAIGPILQGLNKPINDLSRGCLVEDIVNTIVITAIQAGFDK